MRKYINKIYIFDSLEKLTESIEVVKGTVDNPIKNNHGFSLPSRLRITDPVINKNGDIESDAVYSDKWIINIIWVDDIPSVDWEEIDNSINISQTSILGF